LVVLLDDPLDPTPALTAKAVAKPLESLLERGVIAGPLP
jgi:hypothetical protein